MNTDAFANAQAYSARMAAIRRHNRTAIVAVLATHGVATVTIEFNGYGDEGQIECPSLFDADGKEIATPDITVDVLVDSVGDEQPMCTEALNAALKDFVYDTLGDLHGGWQDNEGAYGELTIDVAAGTATLNFNARIVESINTTTLL